MLFRLGQNIFQKQTIVPVLVRFLNALARINAVSSASLQVTETVCTTASQPSATSSSIGIVLATH
jgi:hypothetical protein